MAMHTFVNVCLYICMYVCIRNRSQTWCSTIPKLIQHGKLKQKDCHKFKASLSYRIRLSQNKCTSSHTCAHAGKERERERDRQTDRQRLTMHNIS